MRSEAAEKAKFKRSTPRAARKVKAVKPLKETAVAPGFKESAMTEAALDVEFEELTAAAKAEIPDLFVPKDGVECSKVNDWVDVPPPFCEVMGTPGLPCGHIIQAVGDSDTGKTTFCIHALIGAQRAGGLAILLDSEHKFDIDRAVAMGLDRNRLMWIRVRTIEQTFDSLVKILRIVRARNPTKKVVIIWDSLGGTPCEWEVSGTGLDGEEEDGKKVRSEYAPAAAKAIKGGLRKTRYFIQQMNAAFVIINQFYTRTDLKGPAAAFAKKKKAYGGEGPKYFSTIVLEFTCIGKLIRKTKDGTERIGIKSRIEGVKNHIAPPFKTVDVEIDGKGVVYGGRKAGDDS